MKSLLLILLGLGSCLYAQISKYEMIQLAENAKSFQEAKLHYLALLKTDQLSASESDSIYYLFARKSISFGQLDTSLLIINHKIANIEHSNEQKFLSSFYTLKAAVYHHKLDLDSAIFYYIISMHLDQRDGKTLKVAYTKINVGNIFLTQHNWDEAEHFFSEALQTIREEKDSLYLASVIISLATAKYEKANTKEVTLLANEALQIATARNDVLGLLLSYRQLGHLEQHKKALSKALDHYLKAFQIAEKLSLPYYLSIASMDLLAIYNALEDYHQAIYYGENAIQYSGDFTTQSATICRNLAYAYEHLGKYEKAFYYMKKANDIREKVTDENNQKIVNQLKEQYIRAEKDREIAEQDLVIAKEKEKRIMYSLLALVAILGVLLLLALLFFKNYLYKIERQKTRTLQEKQLLEALISGENNERKRISHELHDGISNHLFNLKLSLSSKSEMQHDELKTLMDYVTQLQEETRRIAHNLLPIDFSKKTFAEVLERYTQTLNLPKEMKLHFHKLGNEVRGLKQEDQLMLFRIIQELLGNSIKYSHATELTIQVFESKEQLKIQLEDNGVGMQVEEARKKGQGLNTVFARLHILQTHVVFESNFGQGTFIEITI